MAYPSNWPQDLTSLANRAMAKIGSKHRFTDIATDDNDNADTVRDSIYDVIREVQAEFRWPELETLDLTLVVEELADTNGRDFAYRYPLPDNYLRPLDEKFYDYRISGGFVYCGIGADLPFHYIRYDEDVTLWSAMLYKCVMYRLAMDVSLPITQTDAIASGLLAEYEEIVEPKAHRVESYSKRSPNTRRRQRGAYGAARRGYTNRR